MTTTLPISLLLILSIAFPDRIPCVTIATTSWAPCFLSVCAAFTRVPQVSAISSTRIAILFWTSPTKTILLTSFGRERSLWIRAKFRSRRSAIAVALPWPLEQANSQNTLKDAYLFAPPASGETMTALR